MDPLIVVVDGNNLMLRSHHASVIRKPDGSTEMLTTSDGRESGALFFSVKHLLSLWSSMKPTHLVYFYDWGRSSYRSGLRPEYKANRGPRDFDLSPQFDAFHYFLSLINVRHYREKNVEADDLIARAALDWASDEMPVVIVSADHDLRQLVSDNVSVLKPSLGTSRNAQEAFFTPATVEEKHGLPPGRLAEMWALTGDDGDNVKGLFRVGEKTAKKMLDQHGTLLDVIKNDKRFEDDQALRSWIIDNYLLIHLDGSIPDFLVDLDECTFDPEIDIMESDLRAFFQEWEFGSLLKVLDQDGLSGLFRP